jgi:hypothetical protein
MLTAEIRSRHYTGVWACRSLRDVLLSSTALDSKAYLRMAEAILARLGAKACFAAMVYRSSRWGGTGLGCCFAGAISNANCVQGDRRRSGRSSRVPVRKIRGRRYCAATPKAIRSSHITPDLDCRADRQHQPRGILKIAMAGPPQRQTFPASQNQKSGNKCRFNREFREQAIGWPCLPEPAKCGRQGPTPRLLPLS